MKLKKIHLFVIILGVLILSSLGIHIKESFSSGIKKPDIPQGGVDAPYADEAAGSYDTSQVGSSIMNSQVMNPGAALDGL